MIVGAYNMQLYCDHGDECLDTTSLYGSGAWSSDGMQQTYTECLSAARKAGWKISRDKQKCQCPACTRAGKKIPQFG